PLRVSSQKLPHGAGQEGIVAKLRNSAYLTKNRPDSLQCTAVRLVYSRIVSLPFSKLLQKLTTKATNLAGGDGPWLRRKRSRARRPRMRRLELDAAVAVLRAGIAAGRRLRAGDLVGRGPTTSRAEAEPR